MSNVAIAPWLMLHDRKKMKYTNLILLLFVTSCLNAEYIKLESEDGRKINVKILSIEDSSIRVERKDGHEFTIENALLSKASLDLIRPLRIKNEIAGSRSFDIGFSEKRTDKSSETFDFHGLDITKYQKKITIRKPDTLDIDGLELRYVILFTRDASKELPAYILGTEQIKNSISHSKLEYESPVYALRRMYVLPNHWWDRNKKEYEDEEEGTWARLYYNNMLIYEECSPKRLSEKHDWDEIVKVTRDPFSIQSQ